MTDWCTDWVSGERVFAPPNGTLDPDWLVPALLEAVPGSSPAEAADALRAAWRSHRLSPDVMASPGELDLAAAGIVAAAVRDFGVASPRP